MFLSSNSSFSSSSNITIPFTDQQQQQQQHPMFDKPFFSNDVSPNNFKHYQHHQPSHPYLPPFPTHEPSFFHFSPTFIDHNHEEEVGFLQNHHHHHQEVLLTTSLVDTFATIIPTTNTCSQTLLEAPPYNIAVIAPMKGNGSKMIKNDKKCLSNDLITTNEKINSLKNKRCSSTSSKKDRHSKIITAQGPRDRRMRLSLKVARPFFTLQDMLGFDKASKTVEWLLMNSKTEINELKRNRLLLSEMTTNKRSCSGSYTSECEVVSEIEISNTTTDDHQQGNAKKEKRVRRSRKPPTFHPLAKESRAKARERARERTIGKIWSRSMPPTQCHPQGNNNLHNNLNQSRSTGPFEFDTGEESGTQSHEMKSTLEMVAEVEEPSSHSFEDSIVINSNSSASQMFNYQHEIKTSDGINWDIDDGCANSSFCATSADINHLSTGNVNDPISSPFHLTTSDARVPSQLIDFQFFDKPWQTYNSEGP